MAINMHYDAKYSRVDEYTHSRINEMLIATVYNGYGRTLNPVTFTMVDVDTEWLRYACYWLTRRQFTATEVIAMTIISAKYSR